MPQFHQGSHQARGLRVAIVAARFNELYTEKLLRGALDCLERNGVEDQAVHVVRVPGAFEIPLCAKVLARSMRFDAIVCLGAVIRGETAHFEYVSGQVASGITQVALESEIPVTFGVLTTDTPEQTMKRCGHESDNKGWEAALVAIELANLLRDLRSENS